jgi:hypothetical protein
MSNYEFTHPEYDKRLPEWKQNRDAVAGEDAIKAGKATYLPNPTPTDKSAEANSRYDNYVQRAVFTNASGRTVEGLVLNTCSKTPMGRAWASLVKPR